MDLSTPIISEALNGDAPRTLIVLLEIYLDDRVYNAHTKALAAHSHHGGQGLDRSTILVLPEVSILMVILLFQGQGRIV